MKAQIKTCSGPGKLIQEEIYKQNVEPALNLLQTQQSEETICLLLFLREKFVPRRQLTRFRNNSNCSFVQDSTHLAAVTLTADGCVNNIKFASYLMGYRPLTCKRIKLQRDSDHLTHEEFFMSRT